ncbi:MAG: hypothetical protein JWP81_2733 [Ferruginibacter sp.]|nr:hypothetical protein [Ferruginibacter sp.]
MIPLLTGICLLITSTGKAKLVGIARPQPYLAVFSDPGDLDSCYLTALEKGYSNALPDIPWPAIGNNLVHYYGFGKGHPYNHSLKKRKLY